MNPLRTPEDYELFLYTLTERYPIVRRSTVSFVRRGATLARVSGVLYFDEEIRLVVRERLLYHRLPSSESAGHSHDLSLRMADLFRRPNCTVNQARREVFSPTGC